MIKKPLYRQDEIVRLCEGKRVLHLGFIHHDFWRDVWKEGAWLHEKILQVAKSVVGVDYLQKEVDEIRREVGCECYVGDVMRLQDLDLNDKYDVILCGELIEHIESARDLLNGMKRFCHAQTQIIFTTPNPWDRKWIKYTRAGKPEVEWLNPEHVVWYSSQTLRNLFARCGYEVVHGEYYFENSRQLDKSLRGLGKIYWLMKRFARRVVTQPHCQPGMLFIVRLKA